MKVTFRTNLGRDDAKVVGLDAEKCHRGATVEVTAEQAKALTKKYPAIFDEPAEAVHGVASRPAITAPAKDK